MFSDQKGFSLIIYGLVVILLCILIPVSFYLTKTYLIKNFPSTSNEESVAISSPTTNNQQNLPSNKPLEVQYQNSLYAFKYPGDYQIQSESINDHGSLVLLTKKGGNLPFDIKISSYPANNETLESRYELETKKSREITASPASAGKYNVEKVDFKGKEGLRITQLRNPPEEAVRETIVVLIGKNFYEMERHAFGSESSDPVSQERAKFNKLLQSFSIIFKV